jgi:glutathionylspermidine synthase
VEVTEDEVDELFLAGQTLYHMLVDAADAVIEEGRLAECGIPAELHELIRLTWHDERHLPIFGRFDLAGGIAGQPPRLIEFNADTPVTLPETSVLQWALVKANGLDETRQFNLLYERLVQALGVWKAKNADLWRDRAALGLPPALALTYLPGLREDPANLDVFAAAAEEAGFKAHVVPLPDVTWADDGVFVLSGDDWARCDFVLKLIPWEYVAEDEPELLRKMKQLVFDRLVTFANPPYSLVLQSKALLAEVWAREGPHEWLLEASRTPLSGTLHVEKPFFGREGKSVVIYAPDGTQMERSDEGANAVYPRVYQAFADFPHDEQMRLYQTGLFVVHGEPVAVGFRRGGIILGADSQFCGHIVTG